MRLLFAITVFSFCVVLWVALALARRIRRSQIMPFRPARHPAAQEFFEAGEFRTPRPLRLEQEIFQQRPRRPLAEMTFASQTPAPIASHPAPTSPLPVPPASQANIQRPCNPEPIPIRPATAYASLFGQTVPIARLDHIQAQHLRASAPEILAPAHDTAIAQAGPVAPPMPFTLHRKPPQTARPSGLRRRIDLSHYNKDMGDLTDPYTSPLRGSGTQGPVPTDRTNR